MKYRSIPENDTEREYFEQNGSSYWQMFLLARHRQRGLRKSPVIEGELEGDVHGVEKDFLAHKLDL